MVMDKDNQPAKMRVLKASNLSSQRAQAATPEKMAAQFTKLKGLYTKHEKQGRCENENGHPSADQLFNTDEGHPGHAAYNAVGAGPDMGRVFRIVDGERVEYHASTVITTRGTGHLSEKLTGCIQQAPGGKTAAGHLAENLPTGRNAAFFAATACGGMTEEAFYVLAKVFIHEVGKATWDKSLAWNKQDESPWMFERRPIYWLLDGHFSHTFWKTLQLLQDHDVHVVFSAAGGSELDQVCDNGIMACVQATFGDYKAEWTEKNPGCCFEPPDWNSVYMQTIEHIRLHKGSAMKSAWAKTGWFPFIGIKAANYTSRSRRRRTRRRRPKPRRLRSCSRASLSARCWSDASTTTTLSSTPSRWTSSRS